MSRWSASPEGSEDIAYNPQEIAWFSEPFRSIYRDQIAWCDCSIVLNAAPGDVENVRAAVLALLADTPMVIGQYDLQSAETIRHAVSLEVGALWLAAAVAALASLVAIVQMMARLIGSRRSTATSLSALGATRNAITRAWLLIVAPVIGAGAVGALIGAVALSPLFPRGLARRGEPSPGIRLDAAVIAVGGMLLIAATTIVAWTIASRSTRSEAKAGRRSATTARFAIWPSPPAIVGTTLAVDPTGDRSRLAAVSAVLGVALGIAGFLAVDIIERSTDDVLDTPSSYAADWDLEITESPSDPDAVIAATMAEPIAALAFKQAVGGTDFTVIGPDGTALRALRTRQRRRVDGSSDRSRSTGFDGQRRRARRLHRRRARRRRRRRDQVRSRQRTLPRAAWGGSATTTRRAPPPWSRWMA